MVDLVLVVVSGDFVVVDLGLRVVSGDFVAVEFGVAVMVELRVEAVSEDTTFVVDSGVMVGSVQLFSHGPTSPALHNDDVQAK